MKKKLVSYPILAPWALLALTFWIPLGISFADTFWIISLILILLTPTYRTLLPSILKKPLAWFSIGLFIIALLACFWGEASPHEKFSMMTKYLKFLFFPLLIAGYAAGFPTKTLRDRILHVFLAVMAVTACLSILKWTGLLIWSSADPGEVFYNHIMTGLMMTYAAYISAWLFYVSVKPAHQFTTISRRGDCQSPLRKITVNWKHIKTVIYALLFLLFTFQIFFVSPGRTGYFIYILLTILFIFQIFPIKKAFIALLISCGIFGAIYYESPVVQQGVFNISHDMLGYKNNYLRTSLGYRLQFHTYSKELFKRHWIIGNGTAGFAHAFHEENPIPSWTNLADPHSQYWLFLSEFGLLGFLVFCLFLCALIREILQLKEMRVLAVGIFAIFLVGNLTDSLFYYATTNLFFLTMMAMCLGEKYANRK